MTARLRISCTDLRLSHMPLTNERATVLWNALGHKAASTFLLPEGLGDDLADEAEGAEGTKEDFIGLAVDTLKIELLQAPDASWAQIDIPRPRWTSWDDFELPKARCRIADGLQITPASLEQDDIAAMFVRLQVMRGVMEEELPGFDHDDKLLFNYGLHTVANSQDTDGLRLLTLTRIDYGERSIETVPPISKGVNVVNMITFGRQFLR